jgi:hypothetical protein
MPKFEMTEDASRFWTVVFGAVTTVGLLFGGVYSLMEYWDGRERTLHEQEQQRVALSSQNEATRLAAQQAFATKHLETCSEAARLAATIATSTGNERAMALQNFLVLYWGPLAVVEGSDVEGTMVQLGKCLADKCPDSQLRQLSLDLAHACRKEVEKNFEVHLPELPPRTLAPKSR